MFRGARWFAVTSMLGLLIALPSIGQALMCRDFRGAPVAMVPMVQLPDVAMARNGPMGEPIVFFNPMILDRLKPQTRDFFYFHECAHHVLGHSLGLTHPLAVEQQADCWAVQMLMRSGRLRSADLLMIQSDVAQSPGDGTHVPGLQRAFNLQACLLMP